jgi:hypothetical protein
MEIRVPSHLLPGLAKLGLYAGKLPMLGEVASELGPKLSLQTLRKQFADKAGIPFQDSDVIVSALIHLLHLLESADKSITEVLGVMTLDLEERAPEQWRSENLDNWKKGATNVAEALNPDGPLAILHKTLEITTAHQNVFESARIFTDVRPVFNSSASGIFRAVVTHMLTVSSRNADGQPLTSYFALDSYDVEQLKKRCDRALTKAATIKAGLSSLAWPTDIAGEERKE